MKKIIFILVLLIFFLGSLIRGYKLGEAPAGLYIDEAGQGYSAYSILKTGKDEFGKSFPFVFRSFTDFKTPVYIYLIVPLIPFFDLTPLTVRLPSFVFSILTFPLIFLLLSLLTSKKYNLRLSLLTSFLLGISPWHTLFGRTNFECNVALFIYLLAIYFFYLGLKKKIFLIFSAITFAIAFPAYHSERFLVPVTVLALMIRFKGILSRREIRKTFITAFLVGIILALPTLSVFATPGFLVRATGLNIFTHQTHLPSGYLENYTGPISFLINSPYFLSTHEFLSLYFSYFSPRYMFNLGDSGGRSSYPDLATFYVWQLPFYLLGLYLLFKKKDLGEIKFLTILLLIIAPIPAAITRDPYITVRALPLVIPQLILISLGIIEFFAWLKVRLRLVAALMFLILTVYSVLQFYSSAILLNEYYRAKFWNFGLEEVSDFVKVADIPIVFDNARDEYYIELLFFLKYDPEKYQKENFEVPLSQYYTNLERNKEKKIGKVVTRSIVWERDLLIDQYLIGDELAISYGQIKEHSLSLVREILYPDKSFAFRIVRSNPEFEKQKRDKFKIGQQP